jgi:gluconate 2-dehydrogenase gamma chain
MATAAVVRASVFEGDSVKRASVKTPEYRGERWRALSVRQARLVDAIAARILPTTDRPGAAEAGAVFYVDRALAEAYPDLLPFYARGLRAVDQYAKGRFGDSFLKLSDEQ